MNSLSVVSFENLGGSLLQKIGASLAVMIETLGLCVGHANNGTFGPASVAGIRRTVADRAQMKVALSSLGWDANVAPWLTSFFPIILCRLI